MCSVCLRSPCDYRCPNSSEPPVIYACSDCGTPIRAGSDYFEVAGEPYCDDCVRPKTAEGEG